MKKNKKEDIFVLEKSGKKSRFNNKIPTLKRFSVGNNIVKNYIELKHKRPNVEPISDNYLELEKGGENCEKIDEEDRMEQEELYSKF